MLQRKTILAGILLLGAAVFGSAQQVVEEIVAIVNDEAITLSEFKREYDERLQAAQAQYKGEALDKAIEFVKTHILDEMITDVLLLQMAKTMNINVTDQLKMIVENIKKTNEIESDDEFKRALSQQGYNYDDWIGTMEKRIMREAVLRNEVGRKVVIDDAEIVDYYKKHQDEFVVPDEYQLRAVYLTIENKEAAALEARKAEIEAKVKSGTPFETVAETDSDEPLKEAKGSLGTFKENELDKTLLAAVKPLKKGEVTSWVQNKNGWYLLQVEDRKDSRVLPFDEARGSITEKIGIEKQNVEVQKFLAEIKTKNYIKILKPNPFEDKS
ncbi:MAG: peptidyl-prolyl cis-trans isomerase [Candidatus Aminicenantes bacterium]|nr:peptidyl-prolyl cis-trans isomerase [Candidatus Aminicenantes bacterium]